ncbi:MAG: MFS transporter [Chloroflexota bacterium]
MTRSRAQEHASDGLWSPRYRNLTVGLILTITLVAFEALAVSTVMPIVARELGDLELYGWVFTAFMLGSFIGIVVSGGVIDRRGLGRPFVAGIALFVVGLVIAGLAPSMSILVVARFLQGLGAGAIPPIAYVAIGRCLPERLRPVMFATLSTAWVMPGVIGPAIAGIVGESIGWRFVFIGLLPLIAVAAVIAFPAVRRVGGPGAAAAAEAAASASFRRRLPLALLVAVGAGLFLAGLSSGEVLVLGGLVVAGLVVGLPALRGLTPPGTLRLSRGLPAAVMMRGILTFTFFAVDAYVALTLVDWRGLSAVEAGISLTAATLAWAGGSWIQARLAQRYPPDRFVRAGLIVVVIGLASFGIVLVPEASPWLAVPTFGIAGLGMGLAYAPLTLIVLREAPRGEQGSASAALSLTDSLGTALGTGVTGALVAAAVRAEGTVVLGLVAGFIVAVVAGLAGLALSGRLRAASA